MCLDAIKRNLLVQTCHSLLTKRTDKQAG